MCQNDERKKETIVKISNAIVGVSLAAAASSAAALSLGSSRGAVVLGTPVDLTFNVTPDPGSDVASSCISAKLVSGSTPVSDSKVQVTPVQSPGASQVRVRAFITADEPVLTVTLTGGCSGAITRQYTFLAELPESAATASTSSAGSLPLDLARLSPGVPAASGSLAGGSGAGRAGAGTAASSSAAPAKRREAAPPRASRAAAQAERRASASPRGGSSAAAESARPRLIMEPLDSLGGAWLDSPLALRTAQELPAPAATTTDAQRTEAAALWRALNTPPEEVQQAAGRITQLEAAAAGQRAQVNAERAAAADLRQRLETVESSSFPAIIVYSLIALLLAALALAYWLWSRARRAAVSAWDHSVQASGYAGGGAILAGSEGAESLSVEPHPDDRWAPNEAPVAPAPAAPRAAAATAAVATATAAAAAAVAAASAPVARPAHHFGEVHPEELFDVQQQAEFFVSVGEHDQAIGVLEAYIATHGDSSPTAYLELLRLFHTLSRAEAFNQLSERFQALFNARVPVFSAFHRQGRTLMEYPETLAQIEAIWSTETVVGLIQTCVVRSDDAACPEPFDLAAYEDLLLLLAIAQTTPAGQRGLPPPRTRTTPQAAAPGAEAAAFAAPLGAPQAALAAGAPDDALDPFALPAIGMQTLPDIHFDSLAGGLSLEPRGPAVNTTAQTLAAVPQAQDLGLDLDLSAFTPAAPKASAPAAHPKLPHSPLDDPFDLNFELDPKGPRKTD